MSRQQGSRGASLLILDHVEEQRFADLIAAYGNDLKKLEQDLAAYKHQLRRRQTARSTGPVVLSVQNISKTYKSGSGSVKAVDDVSFDVAEGEIVALTGPSGSGKSTLLNVISGMDRPSAGEVRVDGTNVTQLGKNKMAAFRCEHIGFVFQFFYLQPFLSVEKNVQVPVMFQRHQTLIPSQRRRRASQLVSSVGLSDRATHRPNELSGGQMQRAAIARALMNQPKLVLADEPTGNLDSNNADVIMQMLDGMCRSERTAIVVVTHDPHVAAFADRTIELVDGRVQ